GAGGPVDPPAQDAQPEAGVVDAVGVEAGAPVGDREGDGVGVGVVEVDLDGAGAGVLAGVGQQLLGGAQQHDLGLRGDLARGAVHGVPGGGAGLLGVAVGGAPDGVGQGARRG